MALLTETVRSYFGSHKEQPLRPIMTSLNGDASWLMSFPLPSTASKRENTQGGKRFYHVVVDPWLKGPAITINPWIAHIERTEPAAAGDAAGVDGIVRQIEDIAAAARGEAFAEGSGAQARAPLVDAIFITLHLLDHLHRPTMETFDKTIPVFAAAQSAPSIRGWGHFDTVVETRDYKGYGDGSLKESASSEAGSTETGRRSHWKSFHPGGPLPEWLSVFRLVGSWEVELATAVVWSHESGVGDSGQQQHEFILDTPHGISVDTGCLGAFFDDTLIKREQPSSSVEGMQCLAILAGLKDSYTFGKLTTIGVEKSLQLERKAEPRYWLRNHDLPLQYSGILFRVLMVTETIRTLEYGLGEEAKSRLLKDGEAGGLRKPNVVKVENGGCLVLD